MLPATGQTAFGLPFPAVDVFHSGYSYVSSPTPGGTLGPYWFFGLERMCVTISSGERRLPGVSWEQTGWRGTPTEAILVPSNGQEIPDEARRIRELTLYDANGDALRFLAVIVSQSDEDEQWTIFPAKGVYAEMTFIPATEGMPAHIEVRGGPPGAIRAGGSWVYRFQSPHRAGWGVGRKGRLHDIPVSVMGQPPTYLPAIVSPTGNSWSLRLEEGEQSVVLRDWQTRRGLRFRRETDAQNPNRKIVRVYYFSLTHENYLVPIGTLPAESDSSSVEGAERSWTVQWGTGAEVETGVRLQDSEPVQTFTFFSQNQPVQSFLRLDWQQEPQREKDMYFFAYGYDIENLKGRLTSLTTGVYGIEQYDYYYVGNTPEFITLLSRRGQTSTLSFRWNRSTGMFETITVRRPSYTPDNPDRAWEYLQLEFAENGQVRSRAAYEQIGRDANGNPIFSQTPRWTEFFRYESAQHPAALTTYIDKQGTQWQFDYKDDPDLLLEQVNIQEGRLGVASMRYGENVWGTPSANPQNPPTAPTSVTVGTDPALTWRFDYTMGRQEVGANGLLEAFTGPQRGWWQWRYYPPNSAYPNKLYEVEDPTGNKLRITAYDLFGRPGRIELYPTGNPQEPQLWSETTWTLMGQPRLVRWGYGGLTIGNALYEYDGLFLKRYRDPMGRVAEFTYDYEQGSNLPAGLLREVKIDGALYAELRYDSVGRLEYVLDGQRKPVLKYRYGIHDELRGILHAGDAREETFDYSCCGRVERWTRQDGRFALFDYTENGWVRTIKEHNRDNNRQHSFGYDGAGRLGRASAGRQEGQNIVSEITLRFWYDTDDEIYGVGADPRNHDNDPTNNLSSARTGWLLGEEVVLPNGATHRWYYEYRKNGQRTADVQEFHTSWGSRSRYEYDAAGRPTALYYNDSLLASWSYDFAGRLLSQTVYLPARALTTSIQYADTQAPNAVGYIAHHLYDQPQPIAWFNYQGLPNDPGYNKDGTLRYAREQLPNSSPTEWRYAYHSDGALAYERYATPAEQREHTLTYDAAGNLTGWGAPGQNTWHYVHNQLQWVGGYHPWQGNYNLYFTYTPNGERAQMWSAPTPIEGDVNGDGDVDDSDLLAVLFAFGQACPLGCPEDINGDGAVDDGDLLVVMFNFGRRAGSLSWRYQYDVWGNLTRAISSSAGVTLEHQYDPLGRRMGIFVHRNGVQTVQIYRLYEGDTLLAEVDAATGQAIAEYLWGPLGPIARIDLTNPTRTRYYLLDGLGHTRVLLTPQGTVAEIWSYDSWGFPIRHEVSPDAEYVAQPLTWNAAFGYEWDCFADTGLYHVGARAYDPRTARWLQRDPIDAASGDPNLYRYCGNDPINQVDPDGTEVEWRDLLDVAGFIPGIGEVADLVNAGLYALEGDWGNAAISLAGVLPGGDALKAGRLAKKVIQEAAGEGAEQVAKQGSKYANKTSGNNEYAQKGMKVHADFKRGAEERGWRPEPTMEGKNGTKVRPDAYDPKTGRCKDLKPDTKRGRKRGEEKKRKYKQVLGRETDIIYYDPKSGQIYWPKDEEK
jgi:RHS repeat-associated protein